MDIKFIQREYHFTSDIFRGRHLEDIANSPQTYVPDSYHNKMSAVFSLLTLLSLKFTPRLYKVLYA
jgi:hypothetical protein